MNPAYPLRLFATAAFMSAALLAPRDAHSSALAQQPRTITYRLTPAADPLLAVDAQPLLDLGGSGAQPELFSRIATVRWQSSGAIVVANRNPPELRFFDAIGRHLRTAGRKGQGPGEYEDIDALVVRRGDSIAVLDRWQRRISFLRPDGAFVSTIRFAAPFATSPYNVTIHSLSDGTMLIGYWEVNVGAPSPQPVTVPEHLGRYTIDGTRRDSLGVFFAGENFHQAAPPSRGGFAFWDRTFGRKGTVVAAGNGFFAGDASAMEVRRYSSSGALLEVHRIDMPRRPVTSADVARYRTESMRNVTGLEREMAQKRVDEMPYPTHYPAYARFLLDARGRIWVQEYAHPVPSTRWFVLDPATGEALAVRFPERFTPHEVSATAVLGVWRDEDGVEHVRVYRLTR